VGERHVVQGRTSGVLSARWQRRRGSGKLFLPWLRSESNGRWRYVAWTWLQPKFAECVLSNIAVCATVAICWRDIAIRDVPICDFPVLRSSQRHVSYLFADISCTESDVAWLLPDESKIFAYLPLVFSNFTSLQSSIAIFQPYFTPLLADEPIVQPSISEILAYISCAAFTLVSQVFADLTAVTLFSQILTYITRVLPRISHLLTCVSRIQPHFSTVVTF